MVGWLTYNHQPVIAWICQAQPPRMLELHLPNLKDPTPWPATLRQSSTHPFPGAGRIRINCITVGYRCKCHLVYWWEWLKVVCSDGWLIHDSWWLHNWWLASGWWAQGFVVCSCIWSRWWLWFGYGYKYRVGSETFILINKPPKFFSLD